MTISKKTCKICECVRGIYTNLESTIGYLVWEATRILEVVAFKVRRWVCDGATPNRAFFKINGVLNQFGTHYYTIYMFSPDRNIYFISDVPHLLKTTRKNLENSHWHMNTRDLHVIIVYWG